MTESEARRRFGAAAVARLATVSAAGEPHLVPITFAVDAGGTVMTAIDAKPKTTRNLQRLANIEANPAVSVLVDHYDPDWDRLWWVRCDGRASVAAAVPRLLEPLRVKYPQYASAPLQGPVIMITPHRWRWWTADGA